MRHWDSNIGRYALYMVLAAAVVMTGLAIKKDLDPAIEEYTAEVEQQQVQVGAVQHVNFPCDGNIDVSKTFLLLMTTDRGILLGIPLNGEVIDPAGVLKKNPQFTKMMLDTRDLYKDAIEARSVVCNVSP